jgi:hypothetical protein
MPQLCLHCEKAPQQNSLRLCDDCASVRGIRRLYRKGPGWTPKRDARIQALVEKAKRQEPLFPKRDDTHDPPSVTPTDVPA